MLPLRIVEVSLTRIGPFHRSARLILWPQPSPYSAAVTRWARNADAARAKSLTTAREWTTSYERDRAAGRYL
jgi:hypothetical protein